FLRPRGKSELLLDLLLDPAIGLPDALFEAHLRLPAEHPPQPRVVGVAAAHALRAGDVALTQRDAGNLADDVGELVDRDQPIRTEIQRLAVVRCHQPLDALEAVADVAERSRLLAVAPDVDLALAGQLRRRHLAAHRRRRLLASAVPGAERTVDVVEAHDARLDPVVLTVMRAEPLCDQLLPAVGVLRLGRVGVFFLQRRHRGFGLLVLGVDARRRRIEIALHAGGARRLERVEVDQRVVVENQAVVRRDVAHAAHVGGERVDVIDAGSRGARVRRLAQIEDEELVGGRALVLGALDVDAADPVPLAFQIADEMMADESAGAGDEYPRHDCFAAIGIRHPVPNARSVTLRPGAACFRLNSAIRTSRSTRSTVARSNPAATISSAVWCRSTCRCRMSSSTSYGGSESWSVWFGRSSADGAFVSVASGMIGRPADSFRQRDTR